jgi:hypothetical protein
MFETSFQTFTGILTRILIEFTNGEALNEVNYTNFLKKIRVI